MFKGLNYVDFNTLIAGISLYRQEARGGSKTG